MFGKKRKARIHTQAHLLIRDCVDIMADFFEEASCAEQIDSNPAKTLKFMMSIVGTAVYLVASMNKIETAQEMVEQYGNMVGTFENDVNPERITSGEAKRMLNGYYQIARGVYERLTTENPDVSMGRIFEEQARAIFDNICFVPNEEDLKILKNSLSEFHMETFSKYYGGL